MPFMLSFGRLKMIKEVPMKKQWIVLLSVILLMVPALSWAEQFSILGSRALGMGGASVAAVNDSTAVYWNPAALADFRRVDIRIPAAIGVYDHMGLKDTWSKINDLYDQALAGDITAAEQLKQLLNDLDKPNTGADIDASAGLLISIPISQSAMAISALGLGYAGLHPTVDTLNQDTTNPAAPDYIANNHTTVTGIGIGAAEPAVSLATSFSDKVFIGANAKMIYASTYVNTQLITSNTSDTFIDDLRNSKTESNKASLDAGILYAPVENFRIGVVGRDLNSPSFPVEGVVAQKQPSGDVTTSLVKGEITFDAQYRAGIAWRPSKTFTISADYDLTRNKTLVPGYENQTAAVGLEKTFFSEYLTVRAGAYKNTADSSSKNVYAAGLGLRLFALRLDVAGAYDFNERQGQVSADLALRF
jgi:hypothetical protein